MTTKKNLRIRIVGPARCTKDKPMPADASTLERSRWSHPDIRTTYQGILYDTVECPHCGTEWKSRSSGLV